MKKEIIESEAGGNGWASEKILNNMKQLKQCTKCHTMKNMEENTCARCEEKDTESVSGIHSGKDVYGNLEQEIMEMFDENFVADNYEGIYNWNARSLSNCTGVREFISHIITLVLKREREEILEELTRRLIETYKTKDSEDYVKGQYDTLFDLKTYLMTL